MTFDENGEPKLATEAEWRKWFVTHPERLLSEDERTAREYNFPVELVSEFHRLAAMKMTEWPEGLYDHVQGFCKRYGMCGEVMYTGIGDWLRIQNTPFVFSGH
jgi:hypothetical protein